MALSKRRKVDLVFVLTLLPSAVPIYLSGHAALSGLMGLYAGACALYVQFAYSDFGSKVLAFRRFTEYAIAATILAISVTPFYMVNPVLLGVILLVLMIGADYFGAPEHAILTYGLLIAVGTTLVASGFWAAVCVNAFLFGLIGVSLVNSATRSLWYPLAPLVVNFTVALFTYLR